MTSDQFQNQFLNDINIIYFDDLANLTLTPDRALNIFTVYKKIEFSQNDRLVFYTKHCVDFDIIKHIKIACDQADISPTFVLLVCPNNIMQSITQVCAHNDRFDFIRTSVDSNELSNNYKKPSTICPVPWMNLQFTAQGNITSCCLHGTAEGVIGSIFTDTPRELFHTSHTLTKLRTDLQNGIRHELCKICWDIEDNGGTSSRQELLKWHQDIFFKKLIDAPSLVSLDIKAGNVCNFKCRICNSENSSKIAAEEFQLTTSKHRRREIEIIQEKSKWFDVDSELIESRLLTTLNDVVQIDFFGGEPFLAKSLEKMLDYIISIGRADKVRLHFNTNGSVFPKSILSKLKQFQQIDIGLSIDDVGERFEITRGGSWNKILQNIKLFQQLDKNIFALHIYATVSILNVYYLQELLDWAENENINLLLSFVITPEYLSINHLTPAAKNLILEKYKNNNHPHIQTVVNTVVHSPGSDGKEFVKMTGHTDLVRSQNFYESHYEIAAAMGYDNPVKRF
jgi:MoaA/NifB/PqqE/SkfB family radical SAM enzyme